MGANALTPVQSSFSSGELSPLMFGRSDLEGYHYGLAILHNMRPDSRGPAISRTGFKFNTQYAGDDGRIVTLAVSDIRYYSIIFTDLKIDIVASDGATHSFTTIITEDQVASMQAIYAPDGDNIYFIHENFTPFKLTYNRTLDTFSWAAVSFTSTPATWTGSNYPSCGDFFEGRLWLAGTPNEPQTFWASKSGLHEDFTTGPNADDSLIFTLAKRGRIEWLVGYKNLVIGTQNGEHIVTSDQGVITPSDIEVTQQSSYGSANTQPAFVGDQIFYVSADRRKLRAIQYQWQEDNWVSKDLTFNSEHITKSGIRSIVWQQNPDNLFHCILEDGTLASLTYERGKNLYGWNKSSTQGKLLSGAVGVLNGTDIFVTINQYDTGFVNFENEDSDRQFVDSWIEASVSSGVVSGLTHLEGKTCQILVDGAVQPDIVVSSGAATLQVQSGTAKIGLKMERKLRLLPSDFGAYAGSGSGLMKRWSKIFVRILESALPKINGKRPPSRNPSTPMDSAEPLVTGDIDITELGYDRRAEIEIIQDVPLDLKVLGVYGELTQSSVT